MNARKRRSWRGEMLRAGVALGSAAALAGAAMAAAGCGDGRRGGGDGMGTPSGGGGGVVDGGVGCVPSTLASIEALCSPAAHAVRPELRWGRRVHRRLSRERSGVRALRECERVHVCLRQRLRCDVERLRLLRARALPRGRLAGVPRGALRRRDARLPGVRRRRPAGGPAVRPPRRRLPDSLKGRPARRGGHRRGGRRETPTRSGIGGRRGAPRGSGCGACDARRTAPPSAVAAEALRLGWVPRCIRASPPSPAVRPSCPRSSACSLPGCSPRAAAAVRGGADRSTWDRRPLLRPPTPGSATAPS